MNCRDLNCDDCCNITNIVCNIEKYSTTYDYPISSIINEMHSLHIFSKVGLEGDIMRVLKLELVWL